MPWKLIVFIAIFVLFVIFASLNIDSTFINFGLFSLDAPLFVSLMIAFLAGASIAIPMTIVVSAKKQRKAIAKQNGKKLVESKKRQKKDEKESPLADKIKDEE